MAVSEAGALDRQTPADSRAERDVASDIARAKAIFMGLGIPELDKYEWTAKVISGRANDRRVEIRPAGQQDNALEELVLEVNFFGSQEDTPVFDGMVNAAVTRRSTDPQTGVLSQIKVSSNMCPDKDNPHDWLFIDAHNVGTVGHGLIYLGEKGAVCKASYIRRDSAEEPVLRAIKIDIPIEREEVEAIPIQSPEEINTALREMGQSWGVADWPLTRTNCYPGLLAKALLEPANRNKPVSPDLLTLASVREAKIAPPAVRPRSRIRTPARSVPARPRGLRAPAGAAAR